MIETKGANGTRKGRGTAGSLIRRIQTAAETITNAKRVPMLTRSARNPSGASAPPSGDDHAYQDRRLPGRLEPGMHGAEEAQGQEAVASHGQQDARLAEVADQERARHARQDAQRDQGPRVSQPL